MRAIRISLAYLAAATLGALTLLVSLWAFEGLGDLASSLIFFPFATLLVMVVSAPVALPAIFYSEWRGISTWRFFAAIGSLSGLLAYLLFAEFPQSSENALEALVLVGASVIAGSAYWLFAGCTAGREIKAGVEIPKGAYD